MTMQIYRDVHGNARWLSYSSNAFRDADDEIVSTQALKDDCERADRDGNYGPLRWWHLPGMDIGKCDFNMVVGRTLIESGTFKDDRLAEKLASGDYQISIGFRHPVNQPNRDGVFDKIYRFERSVVPAGRVANRFTQFMTIKKESTMASVTEKLRALKTVFGDDELIQKIISGAQQAEKEADELGIDWKEYSEKAGKKKKMPAEDEMMEEEVEEEEVAEEEKDGDSDDWDETPVIGDMPLDDFASMLAESVDAGLEPIVKELQTMKEWQANTESGISRTAQALKEAKSKESERFKEEMSGVLETVQKLSERVKELESELGDARTALKELLGDQPNASYRASEDPDTAIGDNHRLKSSTPGPDPMEPFFNFVVGGN